MHSSVHLPHSSSATSRIGCSLIQLMWRPNSLKTYPSKFVIWPLYGSFVHSCTLASSSSVVFCLKRSVCQLMWHPNSLKMHSIKFTFSVVDTQPDLGITCWSVLALRCMSDVVKWILSLPHVAPHQSGNALKQVPYLCTDLLFRSAC